MIIMMSVVFVPCMAFAGETAGAAGENVGASEPVGAEVISDGEPIGEQQEDRGEAEETPAITDSELKSQGDGLELEYEEVFVYDASLGAKTVVNSNYLSTEVAAGDTVYMVTPDWSKINNKTYQYFDVDPYMPDQNIPVVPFTYGNKLTCSSDSINDSVSIEKVAGSSNKYRVTANSNVHRGQYYFEYLDEDYGIEYSLGITVGQWEEEYSLVSYKTSDYSDGFVAFNNLEAEVPVEAGKSVTISLGTASEEDMNAGGFDDAIGVTPFEDGENLICTDARAAGISITRTSTPGEYIVSVPDSCEEDYYEFTCFDDSDNRYVLFVTVLLNEDGYNNGDEYETDSTVYSDIVKHAVSKGRYTVIGQSGSASAAVMGNVSAANPRPPLYSGYGVFRYTAPESGMFTFSSKALSGQKDIALTLLKAKGDEYTIIDWMDTFYEEGDIEAKVNGFAEEGEYLYVVAEFYPSEELTGSFTNNITVKAQLNLTNEINNAVATLEDANGKVYNRDSIYFYYHTDWDEYVGNTSLFYSAAGEVPLDDIKAYLSYVNADGEKVKTEIPISDKYGELSFNSRGDGTGLDYYFDMTIEEEGDNMFYGTFENIDDGEYQDFDLTDFDSNRELTLYYGVNQGYKYHNLSLYSMGDTMVEYEPYNDWENGDYNTYGFDVSLRPQEEDSLTFLVTPVGADQPEEYTIFFKEDPNLGFQGNVYFTDGYSKCYVDVNCSEAKICGGGGQSIYIPHYMNDGDKALLEITPDIAGADVYVASDDAEITGSDGVYEIPLTGSDSMVFIAISKEIDGEIYEECYEVQLIKSSGSITELSYAYWELDNMVKNKPIYVAGGSLNFKKGSGTKADPYMAKIKVPDKTFSTKAYRMQYALAADAYGSVHVDGKMVQPGSDISIKKYGKTISGKSAVENFKVVSASQSKEAYYKIIFIEESYADLSKATVTGAGSLKFTGKPVTHENLKVTAGGVELEEGKDYSVKYVGNTNISSHAQVIITGKGFYTGRKIIDFAITKGEQTGITTNIDVSPKSSVDLGNLYVGRNSATLSIGPEYIDFSGDEAVAENVGKITVTSSKTKVATVTSNGDGTYRITPKASGTANITIKAAGNSQFDVESKVIPITVVKPTAIKSSMIYLSSSSMSYSGKAKEPAVTVKTSSKAEPLVEGVDYEVSYDNNIEVGKSAKVLVTAGDNFRYSGTNVAKTFTIKKAEQSDVTANIDFSAENPENPGVLYVSKTFATITPNAEVIDLTGDEPVAENVGKFTCKSSKTSIATVTANSDGSFKVTPKGAGTAKITVTASGDNNFNSKSRVYEIKVIKPALVVTSSMMYFDKSSFVYDGTPQRPEVTVKKSKSAKPLVEGEDYTLEYENDVNASVTSGTKSYGTVILTVNPDNYSVGGFEVKKTYTIKKAAQNVDATIDKNAIYLADGSRTRTITVGESDSDSFTNVGEISMKSSKTSVATVSDNGDGTWTVTGKKAGSAKITVTAKATANLNSATKTITVYVEKPKAITAKMITVGSGIYNGGEAVEPEVRVKSGSITLLRDDGEEAEPDYSVTFEDNTKVGKGIAWISAAGAGYTNTEPVKKTFSIVPAMMAKPEVTATSTGFIASWQEVTGEASTVEYNLRYSTKESMASAVTKTYKAGTNDCEIKGLRAGRDYYVQIRVKQKSLDEGDKTVYTSPWSEVLYVER